MRGAFRLGRLFGIDIGIDWSWTLVALMMIWNLTVVFGVWHPTWGYVACTTLGVAATVLFFGSILAHELAHALVAMAFGMKVRDIRLFLFGGVSNIESEPPSPAAEFLMALAGPATSLALGGLALGASAAFLLDTAGMAPLDVLASLGPIATLVLWLGPVNIVVGFFNLLPGFPLDGGRILRATVWALTRNLHQATSVAATMGRIIGWAFIVAGVAMVFGARLPILGHGGSSGLWLAFVGWFLKTAASRTFGAFVVDELLEGVHVGDLMRRDGWIVPPHAHVRDVVDDWFMKTSEHAFPVVDGDRLLGIVSVRDLRALPPATWDETPITVIMTPVERLAIAHSTDDVQTALRSLAARDVEQLPVVDDDFFSGMLSRSDIARWLELRAGVHTTRRGELLATD